MAERRLIYLASLMGCLVFYWAYREWLSGFLLVLVLALPWFSLLISLPAMLTCRIRFRNPTILQRGQQTEADYVGETRFPVPPLKGKLTVCNLLSGERQKLRRGDALPTEHCGVLEVQPRKIRAYDYLGLFRGRIRKRQPYRILIRPEQIPVENPPDMSRYLVNAWKPKLGGGYAENHELRLYRPGDNLRQIHWKLSAKTGKLILREPMEALRGLAVLTMELRGTPEEMDRKLGNLHWMSSYLLQQEIPHQIHCLTQRGMEQFHIADAQQTQDAVDALLCAGKAPAEVMPAYSAAAWRYHIGGDDHES